MDPLIDSGLTIFIPIYNEVENLEAVVRSIAVLMPRLTSDPELIIVDDGSVDGSGELSDELAAEIVFLRVIHHKENRGYGAALQSGFNEASKEIVFYTDGDGQFQVSELVKVLPMIHGADVVSCYRSQRYDPWYRKVNAKLFEWVVFLLLDLKIKDPDCAFKIYRRTVLDRIKMTSVGALIDVEMLFQAQRMGAKIVQVGVSHHPRKAGDSSGANVTVICKAFMEIMSLLYKTKGRFGSKRIK